jgi:sulfoxide reductase catalytic subunit YedY
MLIRKAPDLTYADITPKSVYLNRRKFLQAMGIAGAAAAAGKGLFDLAFPSQSAFAATKFTGLAKSPFSTTEKQNTYEDVTHYNNFYEFGTDKGDPAKNSRNFNTSNWIVSVEGELGKPRKFTMDEILKIAPLEERIYRHRCVEAWSIVVPWIGFSFSNLVKLVEPTSKAQFVAFQSYYDHQQMPQGRYAGIDFPYVEGLRIDEAMNPLALLCVGMYGETLPNQDGGPVRMTLPWTYPQRPGICPLPRNTVSIPT